MPPSTSMTNAAPVVERRRRASASFSSDPSTKGWPPQPGFTLITSSRSIIGAKGRTHSSGVGGFNARPARTPAARIAATVAATSVSASTCTVMPLAPARTNSATCRSGCWIMRCTSSGRAVARRSASTTRGPMVIGGTKLPSITSTWIQSAPAAATARTSSASRPKSADRMEAAIVRTTWRLTEPRARFHRASSPGAEPRRKETVEAVVMRRRPQKSASVDERRRVRREMLPRIFDVELRRGVRQGRHDLLVLLARAGAYGVHEDAPRTDERRDAGEDLPLERGEARHVLGSPAPAQLRMAAERLEPAARGVDEHGVERRGDGRPARVAGRRNDGGNAETVGLGEHAADAGGATVEGDDGAAAGERPQVRRLSARRGARVEEPPPGLRSEQRSDELRHFALEREPARAPGAQPAERGRVAVDAQGLRSPGTRTRLDALDSELRLERVARRDERIRAQRGGRPLVVGRQQRGQLGKAELVRPAGDQPAGVRPFDGEARDRVGIGRRQRQAASAERGGAAEDRVDEPAGPGTRHAGEPHARVDRRVCGDAVEKQQLVEAETKGRPDGRIETLDGDVADERAKVKVEAALPRERPVDEAGRERVLARRERGIGEPMREQDVGKRVRRLDAQQDFECEAARAAGAGQPAPRHVPGGTGWPARKSATDSRRLPSSCSSTRRSRPAPVDTQMPPGPLSRTVPGGRVGSTSCSATARCTFSTRLPSVVNAEGAGANARTARSSCSAGIAQSSRVWARSMRGANVTPSAGCGAGRTVPCFSPSIASPRALAPSSDKRSPSLPAVSSGAIGVERWSRMSPASISSLIIMIVTPVVRSPARIAAWMGAAPRCRGSSEAWTLIEPCGGTSRQARGRIMPYAAATTRSGASRRSSSWNAGSRMRSGCSTGTSRATASCVVSGATTASPRPRGRSGWQTSPTTTSGPASSRSRLGHAKAGVPKKTMRQGAKAVPRVTVVR